MVSGSKRTPLQRGRAVLLWLLVACAPEVSQRAPEESTPPWRLIAEIPELRFSIDTSRIETDAGYHSVWMQFEYASDQVGVHGLRYRTVLLRQEINCSTRMTRSREMTSLDSLNVPLPWYDFPSKDWIPFSQHPMTGTYPEGACMALRAWGWLGPA